MAGHDGAGIYEHTRDIESGSRHEHAGQALIATSESDHAIEPLRLHDCFD